MADEMQSAGRKKGAPWSVSAGKDEDARPEAPGTPKPKPDEPAEPDARYRDPHLREVEEADREDLAELSGMLRRHFDPILEEPVPDRLKDILRRCKPSDKAGSNGMGSNGTGFNDTAANGAAPNDRPNNGHTESEAGGRTGGGRTNGRSGRH